MFGEGLMVKLWSWPVVLEISVFLFLVPEAARGGWQPAQTFTANENTDIVPIQDKPTSYNVLRTTYSAGYYLNRHGV
jgi:hypothetical protein